MNLLLEQNPHGTRGFNVRADMPQVNKSKRYRNIVHLAISRITDSKVFTRVTNKHFASGAIKGDPTNFVEIFMSVGSIILLSLNLYDDVNGS